MRRSLTYCVYAQDRSGAIKSCEEKSRNIQFTPKALNLSRFTMTWSVSRESEMSTVGGKGGGQVFAGQARVEAWRGRHAAAQYWSA